MSYLFVISCLDTTFCFLKYVALNIHITVLFREADLFWSPLWRDSIKKLPYGAFFLLQFCLISVLF